MKILAKILGVLSKISITALLMFVNISNTSAYTLTQNPYGTDAGEGKFIIVIDTNLDSGSEFKIPTYMTIIEDPIEGYDYNYTVEWGDGSIDTNQTGEVTHTYATDGIYEIRISGDFPGINFLNSNSREKLIDIKQWGNIVWENMSGAFFGAKNLVGSFTDSPDLSQVTDMSSMFGGASIFNGDISGWNTSNIKDMNRVFKGASAFNQPIGDWDVSNVNIMDNIFRDAWSFDQDISSWDLSGLSTYLGGPQSISKEFWAMSSKNYEAYIISVYNQYLAGDIDQQVLWWIGKFDVAKRCSIKAREAFEGLNDAGIGVTDQGIADTCFPEDIEQSVKTIPEGTTDAGRLSAVDSDLIEPEDYDPQDHPNYDPELNPNPPFTPTDTHTFELVSGEGDSDNTQFTLTPQGELTINTAPDYENPDDDNNDNVYEILVQVTDSTNETFTKALTITITDIDDTAPSVTLNGDREVTLEVGEEYTELGASCEDTDTTCEIIMRGTVDTTAPGEYTIEYEAKDENGNLSETIMRFVTVVAKTGTSTKGGTTFRPEMHNSSDGHKGGDTSEQTKMQEDISEFLDDTLGSDESEDESDKQEGAHKDNNEITKLDLLPRLKVYDSCRVIEKINNPKKIKSKFVDTKFSRYAPSIKSLEYARVVDGITPHYFGTDRSVTRAEFLKIILRAHCLDYTQQDTSNLAFTDVDKNTWMAKVISKALEEEIIDMSDDKTFRPNEAITKLESTKILMNMTFKILDEDLTSGYADFDKNDWEAKYIAQGEQIGLFRSIEEKRKFNPNEEISRDKMAYFVEKMINLYDTSKQLVTDSDYPEVG